MTDQEFPMADPQWRGFPANPHTSRTHMLIGAPEDSADIGIGAWHCVDPDCGIAHVAIAARQGVMQVEAVFDAATAREIAAALIEGANRVDPKGSQ